MPEKQNRHAANVTVADICESEFVPSKYQKMPGDASQIAAMWVASRYRLPLAAARIVVGLASLGGRLS